LLKGRRIFLLLCGSSIGMMETEVLGYKSPLYGRRTGEWNVEPFNFKDIRNMFKKFPIEEVAKIYFIFGGTPFYLAQIDSSLTVEQNVKKKILTKGEILYSEPRFLLKEEFREPKTYMLILKYLSLGYNTQGELSSATGIEKGNLSKYLSVLEETRLINFVLPLGQRKRGIYLISDPFFNFWFRFVYPNLVDLEIGLVDEVFSKINSQTNSYYGLMFEQLVFELVKNKAVPIDVPYNETRKWWYKDKEIDVIALNGKTNKIIFIECKWQDDVDAEKILEELKEKATYVKWNKEGREEYFAIFAKSFRKKIREPNLKLFDLRSLETWRAPY
jgi:AAA+ ATPase superfamily predicted ATPase